ncbi:XRE family transcriptional regulator [Lactobacillus johnsonii]|uniref:helix-turn-helix domain-containing protein n=1 Tax=Lactobacillus johnsonii TaxID=33959 RepID=UPI000E32D8E1|nr:helix-turn-helix transcriptional regulator [Lactobacillus johnsonii]AXQ18911.1 XRE family transcriptional regulator [Lactobacillus johnsonii]
MNKEALNHNRINELRLNNNKTQKDIADYLGLTEQAIAYYEKGKRTPKPETWQALADFFGVSVPYLQGAYSKDELLLRLQKYYSKYADDNFDITIDTLRNLVYFDIGEVVDEFVISKRLKPWNIKKEAPLLTKEEVADFNYWKKNFNVLFDHAATNWLITKPTLEATEKDIIGALVDALSGEGDNVVLTKRINFLNKHLYYKSRYPIKTFYDFNHPHPLDGKEYYLEDGKPYFIGDNNQRHYIEETE